jgi:hypothetical protein
MAEGEKHRSRRQDVPAELRDIKVSRARARPIPDAPAPQPPPRHFASRGIAALIAPVVRPAFRRRAPAAAQLLADWQTLAGPDLGARAAPVKFAGGTLTLACSGPAAMELQLLSPQIIARLNLALGQAMIERLRFIQQAPPGAKVRVAPLHRPIVATPPDLPEGPLGEALAALYRGIKSRE